MKYKVSLMCFFVALLSFSCRDKFDVDEIQIAQENSSAHAIPLETALESLYNFMGVSKNSRGERHSILNTRTIRLTTKLSRSDDSQSDGDELLYVVN